MNIPTPVAPMMPRTLFNEDHEAFRNTARRFFTEEIQPHYERWEEQQHIDRNLWNKAGELGLLCATMPEEYGGSGLKDFRFEQIILEETGYGLCFECYNTLHSRLTGPYFTNFGTKEQCQRFLPKCVTGEHILAIGMTEPDAGSDLAGMRTNAKDMGDHWLLNGSKIYISNGINADIVVVAAKTDPENNKHCMGLFIVERGMPGFERGRNLNKMGQPAQDTAELFFNNVKIPKSNVLGDPTKGFYYLMEGLAEERLISAVGNLTQAQKAIDITVDFVKQRKAFGKTVADFQNTQFKLAEMRTEIDLAQVFVDHCVTIHNKGELSAVDAAKVKLNTSEVQCRVVDECVQLHGGAGYMDEYPISRLYRDARIARIYAGTSEVMKLIISKDILKSDPVAFVDRA